MNILVTFEYPHTWWNTLIVYKNFYDWFEKTYEEHNITYQNTEPHLRHNPSGIGSPHVMTIRNLDNQKYMIVSYWDRAIELTWPGNGWDVEHRVDLITSAGVHFPIDVTPFSYTCYSYEFEKFAQDRRVPWSEKNDNKLFFRGYLYGERKMMSEYKPELFTESRKTPIEYFDELNNSKISLSLNGAGEVCNRDMEILCSGSVLIRPKLEQRFHNDLIPDFHYISVEKIQNPIGQLDAIIKKYEEIKDNSELLNTISNNGLDWFNSNGSMLANVELLKQIINLDKLN